MSTESKKNGAKINEKSKLEARFGGDNFIQVPTQLIILINSGAIKPLDVVIYMILLNYMNSEKKTAWPSVATIGGIAKRGEKAVSESLSRLARVRLIARYREENWKSAITAPLLIVVGGIVIDQSLKFIDKIEIIKPKKVKKNKKSLLAPNCTSETGENGENDEIPF